MNPANFMILSLNILMNVKECLFLVIESAKQNLQIHSFICACLTSIYFYKGNKKAIGRGFEWNKPCLLADAAEVIE